MSFLIMYVATICLFFTSTKQDETNFCFKGSERAHAAFYGTHTLSSDYSTLSSSIKAILYNIKKQWVGCILIKIIYKSSLWACWILPYILSMRYFCGNKLNLTIVLWWIWFVTYFFFQRGKEVCYAYSV